MNTDSEQLCIDTIRFLAIDAVEKANSGHPGAPMGAAAMTYTLWSDFLRFNPRNPAWMNRDRFLLSAGHASMLLYALLHLTGYDLTLNDIANFRQWGSRTPGHPEHGLTPGVEATTGPLGQGFANGVGMAIAERHLAARYNRPGFEIIDHYTYALCSDGDLMEGISAEAASLAGHLKLGKLIYLYDDNDISIEGSTDLTFTEDVKGRFMACGWQVVGPVDGMDTLAVRGAIAEARVDASRPSLIICRSVIGAGSPNKANRETAHGEPLGKEETILTRQNLKWTYPEPFSVPPGVERLRAAAIERGHKQETEWQQLWEGYQQAFPAEAAELTLSMSGKLAPEYDAGVRNLFEGIAKPLATREASGLIINALAATVPSLMGGAADLAPSTKTLIKNSAHFAPGSYQGRNLHFGVREHAMGALANGMALHGGIIPYTATFMVFYDYMRPPVRLAALMQQKVVFIFTHDSIGLGEDGPTHQPIEHLAAMRSVPNLSVIRPADWLETVEAWQSALENQHGPTVLVLTRQAVPLLDRSAAQPSGGARRGGYILWENSPQPDVILIGTGSEVQLALEAGKQLAGEGIKARVVSLPSWDIFEAQPLEYRRQVLPPHIKARVSVEAASTMGWQRYTGAEGINLGIDHFGASAPARTLFEKFGFTALRVAQEARKLLRHPGS
jgi:transketolase